MGTYENKRKQTDKAIREAFLVLYSENGHSRITVNKICEKSKINRSTFYLYYDSVEALLRSVEDEFLTDFARIVKPFYGYVSGTRSRKIEDAYTVLLTYLSENRNKLLPFFSNYSDTYFAFKYKKMIKASFESAQNKETGSDKYLPYRIAFLTEGIWEMTRRWLVKNELNVEELKGLLLQIVYNNPL